MIRERFTITLEAVSSDDRPPAVRLRGLLKVCLRAFGLRCVSATSDASQTAQDRVGGDAANGMPRTSDEGTERIPQPLGG